MVEDRVADGTRLAELLAAELDGRADGTLGRVAVVDADPDVEPTADGARAYRIAVDGNPIAAVRVQPTRALLAFEAGLDAAVDAAAERELRARPVASEPPRALVFVGDGAAVERAVAVVAAAADAA